MKSSKVKVVNFKLSGGLKFFIIMIAVYLVFARPFHYLIIEASITTLTTFLKILPLLIIVFIFMVGANLYIKTGKVKSHLGGESGRLGWFYAVIAGILISGPPYVLYPLLADLKRGGMRNSLMAVFLFNRNVKIPFLPVMAFYFGWIYTLIISVLIIVFSVFNGMLVGRLARK